MCRPGWSRFYGKDDSTFIRSAEHAVRHAADPDGSLSSYIHILHGDCGHVPVVEIGDGAMAVRGKGDAGVCGQCRQVRSLKVNGSGDPERISISKLVPGFLKSSRLEAVYSSAAKAWQPRAHMAVSKARRRGSGKRGFMIWYVCVHREEKG